MMKATSKILSIMLVIAMLLSLVPAATIAYASTPDPSATYVVDETAEATMPIADYRYNQAGATNTVDGYTLTAEAGDFDARVWATGCPLGNQVAGDGLTIFFIAELPATNAGSVYYCYSGEQNNAETYPFFGFAPASGGYRLLSNKVNGSNEYYNEEVYSGRVPVLLYVTDTQFELYVNGKYIATVEKTGDVGLSERWFYGFQSFWAGNTNTTLTITNLAYLNGKAITEGSIESLPTAVPNVTEEPVEATEAPTEEPVEAFYWEADLAGAYNQVQDGTINYDAETGLYMKKSGTQTGFCSILWSDAFDSEDHTVPYTLSFTAAQAGGYAGNTWDGYAVSFRNEGGSSDTELIRLVPSPSGADVYVSGTKVASIYDTNAHTYDVTFDEANNQIISVKVDGEEKLDAAIDWSAPASHHGIMVKSGHNEATGVELWLTELSISLAESASVATEAPVGPTAVPFHWEADLAGAYNQVQDGTISYDAETGLYMKKSGTQTGFCSILWSDAFDSADHTVPYTLSFTAAQAGGYAGNTWDGYAVSFRNEGGSSDTELIRLVPSPSGADVYVSGTKVASIYDTNAHTYDVTFDEANNQIISVKVDGEEKLDAAIDWSAPASHHGIMVKSGHNDATGVELWLTNMEINNAAISETPTAAPDDPTEAPFAWNADLSVRFDQQQDGLIEYDAENGIHMKKSGTQGGFCTILWSDAFDTTDHPAAFTLTFTAAQAGGYAGNTWDGYGIAIRHEGGASETEVVRLVPTPTGAEVYINGSNGIKVASIYDNEDHTYSVTFDEENNRITSVKIDGVEQLTAPIAWVAPSSYHGIMIKSGHNDATGVELWLRSLSITHPVEDGDSPTEDPGATEAPDYDLDGTISARIYVNGAEADGLSPLTTIHVDAQANLIASTDVDAVMAIVLYDSEGNILNIAYDTMVIAVDGTQLINKEMEAGFNLPADVDNYKVQVGVFDNIADLNQVIGMTYTIQ